jgi:hypothetical protein
MTIESESKKNEKRNGTQRIKIQRKPVNAKDMHIYDIDI